MERRPLPPRPGQQQQQQQKRTWYFAYGSNLHLAQMAKRCPNSRFIGRATLRHYRWMINERGFANVIRAHGYWVEGLVFELNGDDERRLDRNEGVSKQCYLKKYEKLEVHQAPKCLCRRPVPWIVEKGGAAAILEQAKRDGSLAREHRVKVWEEVLVYASPDYIQDGVAKEEYVRRINSGVDDARVLGMTNDYIQRFIRDWIPVHGQATVAPQPVPPQTRSQRERRMSFDDTNVDVGVEWDQKWARTGDDPGRGRLLRETMRTETDRGRPPPAKLQPSQKRRAHSVNNVVRRQPDPYSLSMMDMTPRILKQTLRGFCLG